MQLNEGRFMQNGKCGYILRPEFQNSPDYDPGNPLTLPNPRPLNLSIRVRRAGRHDTKASSVDGVRIYTWYARNFIQVDRNVWISFASI